jgi:hypothetical protein
MAITKNVKPESSSVVPLYGRDNCTICEIGSPGFAYIYIYIDYKATSKEYTSKIYKYAIQNHSSCNYSVYFKQEASKGP